MFILDCSATMAWCFEDEASQYADAVLDCLQSQTAIVPRLWHIEILNVLLVGERRHRIDKEDSREFLEVLQALDIQTDATSIFLNDPNVIHLGRKHQLSAYDAVYLELAIRERLQIATQDKKLRNVVDSVDLFFQP